MNIQLDKLKAKPREISFSEPYTNFSSLVGLVEENEVAFAGPVVGELHASWAGDVVEVRGQLKTAVIVPCSRCLDDVRTELELDVLLSYSRLADVVEYEGSEVELDEDDLGLLPIVGDEIDLRPELANEIIMALPQKPLCLPNCEGLCPICGANWNRTSCKCDRPVFHSGLEKLKKLKFD